MHVDRTHAVPLAIASALLLACNGDGKKDDRPRPPSPTANVMFVTSVGYTGDLGGITGGDARCQDRAAAAGLPGTYLAWLSDSTHDARDRLAGARGWVRPDGLPVADTIDDLVWSRLYYPPLLDEFGHTLADDVTEGAVMTGTSYDGRVSAGDHCQDWTSTDDGALSGDPHDVGHWSYGAVMNCSLPSRLYCLGVDLAEPVEAPGVPPGVRIAFVSHGTLKGNAGAAGFDALCAQEAADAGLPGTFVALVATTTQSAIARAGLDLTRALWYRPDGVKLSAWGSVVPGGLRLLAPITVDAVGQTNLATYGVWTGSLSPGTPSTNDYASASCLDWTSDAFVEQGSASFRSDDVLEWYWSGGSSLMADAGTCSQDRHVYCFQR